MKKIANVIILSATRKFDKIFSYIYDKEQENIIGCRVIIPFGGGNRRIEALVISEDIFEVRDYELKEIIEVVDKEPVVKNEFLNVLTILKDKYICTYGEILRCIIPPSINIFSSRVYYLNNEIEKNKYKSKLNNEFIKLLEEKKEISDKEIDVLYGTKYNKAIKQLLDDGVILSTDTYKYKVKEKFVRTIFLNKSEEEIIDEIENCKIKNINHIRLFELLLEFKEVDVIEASSFLNITLSMLNTLKKNGYIEFGSKEVIREPIEIKKIEKDFDLVPTDDQNNVISRVMPLIKENIFEEILIRGITGSGKTEVYLQLIRECIKQNKRAIVLVPEISLTPQIAKKFIGRFGNRVAIFHSRLSLGERYDQWRLVVNNKIDVVVGARSAIFAPVENIGIIIIDEEHENTYKSEINPKYHVKDIAMIRAKYNNAILIYGSATPSIETFYRANIEEIKYFEMTNRPNNFNLPSVKIVDMRKELEIGNRSIFSLELRKRIKQNISEKKQTVIFVNRRGFSSFVMCRSCGFKVECPNCNVTMTYHSSKNRLICHYCGYTDLLLTICPSCNSKYIRHFGIGTQKVEEELHKEFNGVSTIRMDVDTTSKKNSHEKLLERFKKENINILVGTQMIAKGHDFPNVTLVGVIAADSLLEVGDYRSAERAFQLLTQVAGRAGRGQYEGSVVIQSYRVEDYSIISASNHNFVEFYNQEILLREKMLYPPFINIGTININSINDLICEKESKEIFKTLQKYSMEDKVIILGPVKAPIAKIGNRYRWRIIIKCSQIEKIRNLLHLVLDKHLEYLLKKEVRISIDINPFNML